MKNEKAKYEETYQQYRNAYDENINLDLRKDNAEKNIVKLQEEYDNLKAKRPQMLADNKDISKLNKRLKKIEEEIEINKDTITGLTLKKKETIRAVYETVCTAQNAYKSLIQAIMNELKDKYVEIGTKYAEITKEYITLENLRDGDGPAYTSIGFNFEVPNVKNPQYPLMKGNRYEISSKMQHKVLEKYNIPYFRVARISYSDYS